MSVASDLTFKADFFDGQSAARHRVIATLRASGIALADESGKSLDLWRYDEIYLVDAVEPGQPVRLACRAAKGARLTITDPSALPCLQRYSPHLSHHRVTARTVARASAWIAGGLLVVLAVAFLVPRIVPWTAAMIPEPWEHALGEIVVEQLTMSFASEGDGGTTCSNAAGAKALEELVANLSGPHTGDFRFDVQVVDISEVNAFAAPGGFVLVFNGLLDFAESPDEFAAVLAHEMAHVVERHPTESLIRNLGMFAVLDAMGGGGMGSEIAASLAGTLLFLSYSRQAEAEADELSFRILQDAGLRADGLAAFFNRLEETHPEMAGLPQFLSTHPNSGERAEKAESYAGGGNQAMSGRAWQALKTICQS